jgi:hypothetical protein
MTLYAIHRLQWCRNTGRETMQLRCCSISPASIQDSRGKR